MVIVWRVKAGLSLTGVRERFSERVDLTSYWWRGDTSRGRAC